jgi:S1-C subfamily serine protease
MITATRAASLALLVAFSPVAAEEKTRLADALALQAAMQQAIEKAEPAIACILVDRGEGRKEFQPDSPQFEPESYGSGVVIDEKGLVLTNAHVIRDAQHVYVRLPNKQKGYHATLVASDQRSDLAVLHLTAQGEAFKFLPLGKGEELRKGHFVLSLANPYAAGFKDGSPSASWGIVSNLRRRKTPPPKDDVQWDKPLYYYATLIQTDARLNLGCSGSALLNLKGELVGLTTALAALSGSETPGGFAMPMDAALRRIIGKLKKGEEVEYGFLGVSFTGPNGFGARPLPRAVGDGVPVQQVIRGGPADRAKIPSGCTILAINGVAIHEREDLLVQISTHLAGTTVRVEYTMTEGGPRQTRDVFLAKFYTPSNKFFASKRPEPVGGLRVDYASVLVQRRNENLFNSTIPSGVAIVEVEAHSAGERAQIQPGKVIQEVNGRSVSTPADFYRELKNAGTSVDLTILSPDLRKSTVTLPLR